MTLRRVFTALGAGSAAILATALAIEHVGHALPCTLCLYERVPYAAALALALLQRFINPRILLLIFIVLAMGSALLALYHVGVEQKWWQYTCASSANWVNAMPVRCDIPAIQLFGVSLAMVNAMICAMTALWLARLYYTDAH